MPDTKDWTWVIRKPCPQCGFDAARIHPAEVGAHILRDADDWLTRLDRPDTRTRPAPGVWSVLEYGCHIRDVHRVFNQRVHLMLTEYEPRFPNWDQDETAEADDYGAQDPAVVADELLDAARTVAETYSAVSADSWRRRGIRSNGSEFSLASISRYHLHDIVHHAWDVTPRS